MPELEPTNGKPSNGSQGRLSLLSTLAQSTDKWVQLGTLAFVCLTGIGNWLATWKAADTNRVEIVQGQERIRAEVIRQVQEIHSWIKQSNEEFHQGNEDSAANKKILLKFRNDQEDFEARQTKMLQNQSKTLEDDVALLKEVHAITLRLEEMKRLDQMRGAPP
jgi:Asp-tRNA(Asn)/Glu-tRNA(Gln) amidotransferase C subunit